MNMLEEIFTVPPNDQQPEWEAKFRSFLKKTQADFKRAAADVKVEAERLMKEVQDPKAQAKMKEGAKEATVWAKKTAEQLASLVEAGVKQAEETLLEVRKQWNKPASAPAQEKEAPAPDPTPKNPVAKSAPEETVPTKKTIGRGRPTANKEADGGTRKSIGKRKPPREEDEA